MKLRTHSLILAAILVGAMPVSMALSSGDHEAAINQPSLDGDRYEAAAPGVVEPRSEERQLSATSSGTIVRFEVDEGDTVKAGQVIAEIDDSVLRAQLAAADARAETRKAELERLQNGAREAARREMAAALAEADVALRVARTTLERRRSLAQSGIASHEALDQAQGDFDAAQARRNLVAERAEQVTEPPRAEDVAIAVANVTLAKAEADALRAEIDQTRIRSPIDGVLLRRYATVGETVSAQPPTLVAAVGDVRRLRVRAFVDEADVAHVSGGQPVDVRADAQGDRLFSGTVARVGLLLDTKRLRTDAATERLDTRVLPVLIDLDQGVNFPVGLRVDVMFKRIGHLAEANGSSPPTP